MKRIIFQGLVIVVLFFSTWYLLSQIDWEKLFHIERITKKTEEKLGEIFWDIFNDSGKKIENPELKVALDSILTWICVSNEIEKNQIKLHVLRNNDINAFALPDKHIVIFSGLIFACENEAELCGVICHELAHIEKDHVVKKLIKEVGLSVLLSMTIGNSSSEMINETAKLISSTAYDRSLEKEADDLAFNYLINSEINPEPFADFLGRLSEDESNILNSISWISTHPEGKERAERIINKSKNINKDYKLVLTEDTWIIIKESVKD
ncbi:MAG: peptidase M48 [Bacteroidetes bacterium GWF2_33_16]|nr:MAG: peptidase M48 [Bacteroidetes bacterium GWE2_32_14]OFY06625.1 MAG: peptidase M48 [Bacteroidetes bacterium GWF2_33_16]